MIIKKEIPSKLILEEEFLLKKLKKEINELNKERNLLVKNLHTEKIKIDKRKYIWNLTFSIILTFILFSSLNRNPFRNNNHFKIEKDKDLTNESSDSYISNNTITIFNNWEKDKDSNLYYRDISIYSINNYEEKDIINYFNSDNINAFGKVITSYKEYSNNPTQNGVIALVHQNNEYFVVKEDDFNSYKDFLLFILFSCALGIGIYGLMYQDGKNNQERERQEYIKKHIDDNISLKLAIKKNNYERLIR